MFKNIGLTVVAVVVTLVFGGSGADAAVSAITAPLGTDRVHDSRVMAAE